MPEQLSKAYLLNAAKEELETLAEIPKRHIFGSNRR
jgi:hypothetical protein